MPAPEAARSGGIPLAGDGEPVFHAPWQARAFALTVTLAESGVFSWPEWTEALSAACDRRASTFSAADSAAYAEQYYLAWLEALQGLVAEKGVSSLVETERLADDWKEAARLTPHGQPIELSRLSR